MKNIIRHFQRVDPVLTSVLDHVELQPLKQSQTLLADLCEAIICQQLSDKAGATIYGRFAALFPKKSITHQRILAFPDAFLRAAGMSNAKVGFIKNLAKSIAIKSIQLDQLVQLSDEDAMKELTRLHGVGPWTAEMFLMFSLGREDIFSYGDLGLRRAIQKLYGFTKEPSIKQMEKIAKKWSPYRSYACRILWKSLAL